MVLEKYAIKKLLSEVRLVLLFICNIVLSTILSLIAVNEILDIRLETFA